MPCDFWLPLTCLTANVRALPRAQTSGVVPIPPPTSCCGKRSGRTGAGRCLPGFPLLAHTWGCFETHLQSCPLPFPFQLAALAMKPPHLTGSMQAFNGSLLKQMFCASSVLASELAPGYLQRLTYLGVCRETLQESLLQ